jgi:hypothetical protein
MGAHQHERNTQSQPTRANSVERDAPCSMTRPTAASESNAVYRVAKSQRDSPKYGLICEGAYDGKNKQKKFKKRNKKAINK